VRGQTQHTGGDAGDQIAERSGAAPDLEVLRRAVRADLLLMVTLLIIGCLQLWYELVHDGHVGLGGVVVVLLGAALTLHAIRQS
jgi:hypothetical protein